MPDYPGWYPPGQVCYPPALPTYLKEVYDLQPIVGLPTDDEIIGIYSVIHVANRVSAAPGMHNPNLLVNLADHLFSVQMARYRSRYSLVTFPSDATYTPPLLPAHVPVNLEPVSGVPTDEEMMKVQDAIQAYQDMRRFPTMYDARVSMGLSQHLFDLQMARHMRIAGETQPNLASQETPTPPRRIEQTSQVNDDANLATNNPGTGARAIEVGETPQVAVGIDARELMEQSNRLVERLSQLLERSNELAERPVAPAAQVDQLAERFSQALERLTQIIQQPQRPAEQPSRLVELVDGFLDHFALAFDRSSQRADQLAERSNQLMEHLSQHSEQSESLFKELTRPITKLGDTLTNINKVLVGIQHAVVRSRPNFGPSALDCLVNEKGETLVESSISSNVSEAPALDIC